MVGALADVVEDQFAPAASPSSASAPVRFLPPRRAGRAAAGRARTPVPAGPALPGRHRAGAGGARCRAGSPAPFPLGAEGTTLWLQAAADAWGVGPARFRARHGPRPRRGRRRALARYRAELAGKRVFFFPDSQLEVPLARFLARELGMELVEVGTPYLHRQHLAEELALLPRGTRAQRGPGRRPAARPLPRGPARPRRLRPGPRQPAGGRGPDHQMVDRARVHADPGLRAGGRPRRAVRAAARCAARGWWPEPMQLTVWTYEAPPHVGAMRVATAMEGVHYVLHAPQGDTYADLLFTMIERRAEAPAGHLHHLPGARPRRRHRRAVQDRRPRGLRALPAAGDAGGRLLHRRADPGRPRRPRPGAGPADPGRAAGAAVLPAEGELGRGRDLLPARPRARRPDAPPPAPSGRRASPARGRAATCSGPPPSASATATTSPR